MTRHKQKVITVTNTGGVTFDLQYTGGRSGVDQAVVVAQLCVGHHVLVYHYCLVTRPCERFARFVNSPNYKFATMDTDNDVKALQISGLATTGSGAA